MYSSTLLRAIYLSEFMCHDAVRSLSTNCMSEGSAKVGALAYWIGTVCVLSASYTSFYNMYLHLKNYRRPDLQRSALRILWMVPVYGIASIISLSSKYWSYYIDTIRDVYEAFVIYSFFTLLINYLGGERAVLATMDDRLRIRHMWPLSYCLEPLDLGDPSSFLFIRKGVLQFIVLKPLLAIAIMILKANNLYEDGYFAWDNAYGYITLIYNLSVCWSMYCLVMFYFQCSRDLKPYRPLPKFICVKSIIFLTFWQGLILALFVWAGWIDGNTDYSPNNISLALQDIILCFEMPLFAWMHYHAFPWTDYDDSRLSSRLKFWYAVKDALGIRDIFIDTYLTFSSSPARSLNIPEWGEETSPIRRRANHYGIFLPDDPDRMSLDFSDPEPEEDADYAASKRLVYGDFNFPVIHDDYGHPPNVQETIVQHMNDIRQLINGTKVDRRKEFDSEDQIEERLLQWQNESRSD
ncbi:organic solute transporter Ostalpha-domain-containing protein [Gorgonomyces haynaldii]|nr:organic solute transporter Ostalpha-domain-containing protein [Gorgonomyces haynaldii]